MQVYNIFIGSKKNSIGGNYEYELQKPILLQNHLIIKFIIVP